MNKVSDRKMWTGLLKTGVAAIAVQAIIMPASSAFAQSNGLDEIIVTAQKREENLQSTPLAITAASAAALKEMNVESLLDIGGLAPNVMVGSQSLTGSNSGGFFIRGIGQDRSGIDFDQGVGLYVDGVFMSRSDNAFLDVVDVERIEILRGPQGTLFGKNTIGGAINYITKMPTEEFTAGIDATVGSYSRTDIKATVNVPLTDKLFAKATLGSMNRDGFLKHVIDEDREGDMNTQVGRLQLRALVSDDITVDLSASKTRSKNSGRAYIVDFIDPTDFAIRRYVANSGNAFDESFVSPNNRIRYGGDETFYDYDGYNLAGTLTADLSEALQFKSITSYMEADITSANDWDGSDANVYDTTDTRVLDQFSQEFQLSGTLMDDRLNFVTGLYYLKETPTNVQSLHAGYLSTYPTAPRLRGVSIEVESIAAFLQGTYALTDALSLTAGVRYSKDTKVFTNFQSAPAVVGGGEGSWDDVSPRVALEYQWSDRVMTYISATKGFRSGGLNATFSTLPFLDYQPETVWNYEAGIRADLIEDKLRVNLTAFNMNYDQQQLTARDEVTSTVYIQNVGSAHRRGIELEFQAAPTERLHLHGSLGILNAEFDDVGTARDVTIDSRVLRSPKTTFAVGGSYEIPLESGATVTPSLNYNYRTEQSTTSSDRNTVLLDSYGLLSGRVQYTAPDGNWGLALYGTNFLDKEYFIGGFDFARRETFIGVSQLDVGRPREVGLNLTVDFK